MPMAVAAREARPAEIAFWMPYLRPASNAGSGVALQRLADGIRHRIRDRPAVRRVAERQNALRSHQRREALTIATSECAALTAEVAARWSREAFTSGPLPANGSGCRTACRRSRSGGVRKSGDRKVARARVTARCARLGASASGRSRHRADRCARTSESNPILRESSNFPRSSMVLKMFKAGGQCRYRPWRSLRQSARWPSEPAVVRDQPRARFAQVDAQHSDCSTVGGVPSYTRRPRRQPRPPREKGWLAGRNGSIRGARRIGAREHLRRTPCSR
jgi:hypothetical protein